LAPKSPLGLLLALIRLIGKTATAGVTNVCLDDCGGDWGEESGEGEPNDVSTLVVVVVIIGGLTLLLKLPLVISAIDALVV